MNCIKDILRKNAKIVRNNIDIADYSMKITKNIKEWCIYKNSCNIMLFYPLKNEISLLGILDDKDKNFLFPVVDGNNIYPVLFDLSKGFKKGKFNIQEPIGEKILDYSIIDLIFVPALSVDLSGYRLGYGGGYYDRFLENLSKHCVKSVPVHSNLLFDKLPQEKHDIPVDYIITEKAVIKSV